MIYSYMFMSEKDQNRLLELIISAAMAEAKTTEDDPINEAAPL